jgi:hypothetical protein
MREGTGGGDFCVGKGDDHPVAFDATRSGDRFMSASNFTPRAFEEPTGTEAVKIWVGGDAGRR